MGHPVYGLNDASRTRCMPVGEELIKLGAKVSKFGASLFYWHNNFKLEGIISCPPMLITFCWGGTSDILKNVINRLRKIFLNW